MTRQIHDWTESWVASDSVLIVLNHCHTFMDPSSDFGRSYDVLQIKLKETHRVVATNIRVASVFSIGLYD